MKDNWFESKPTDTQRVRILTAPPIAPTAGLHPMIRKIILEQFLKARQQTATRVMETDVIRDAQISVTTYHSFDKDSNMICEDVVVASRRHLV